MTRRLVSKTVLVQQEHDPQHSLQMRPRGIKSKEEPTHGCNQHPLKAVLSQPEQGNFTEPAL